MYLQYPGCGKPSFLSEKTAELIGIKNGINLSFTTPDKFVNTSSNSIKVYRNGIRLILGALNDFLVSESGGPGTGYDTVVFNGFPPLSFENLVSDYIISI